MDDHHNVDLAGVFVPIITPFNEDDKVSVKDLEKCFEHWNKVDFKGYVVLGSTGEAPSLTWDEKLLIVEESHRLKSSDRLLIVGTGCEAIKDTIKLTKEVSKRGADFAMVVTPSYFSAHSNEMGYVKYYEKVADESPIPIILYSVPGFTKFNLGINAISRLSRHRNIVGMKESGTDLNRILLIREKTRLQDFQVVVGSSAILVPSLSAGCVGVVCGLGNFLGKQVCDFYQSYSQKSQSLLKNQAKILQLNELFSNFYLSGLKAATEHFLSIQAPPRIPLSVLEPEKRKELIQCVNEILKNTVMKEQN